MKIVKFDRSFSSRAITDEVFFSRSTQRNSPIPIAFRRGSRFISPPVPSRPTEVPFILLQESWCTSHRRDVGLFVIEGPLCSLEGALLQVLVYRLGARGGGEIVYTTTRLFSLFLFFLAADKWYSCVLRKPRLRVVKSPWIWFYPSWIEWKNGRGTDVTKRAWNYSIHVTRACPSPWNRYGRFVITIFFQILRLLCVSRDITRGKDILFSEIWIKLLSLRIGVFIIRGIG